MIFFKEYIVKRQANYNAKFTIYGSSYEAPNANLQNLRNTNDSRSKLIGSISICPCKYSPYNDIGDTNMKYNFFDERLLKGTRIFIDTNVSV